MTKRGFAAGMTRGWTIGSSPRVTEKRGYEGDRRKERLDIRTAETVIRNQRLELKAF